MRTVPRDVSVIDLLALVAASCGAPGNDSEATGLIAFREAGCATCHGQNPEGGISPAMCGHTAEQVVLQVRSPLEPYLLPRPATRSSMPSSSSWWAWSPSTTAPSAGMTRITTVVGVD